MELKYYMGVQEKGIGVEKEFVVLLISFCVF